MRLYEVYADGGRLVARGRDIGRMRGRCRIELLAGRCWSCGVYHVLPDGKTLVKIFDLWRDADGTIQHWQAEMHGKRGEESHSGRGTA